ncbi:MAG: hypothetical protein D6732_20215 [Methanobacteriota archaeon]|nr:MAG: hypothetical protein D6732_20215 [Euryarchaeota archaeon]
MLDQYILLALTLVILAIALFLGEKFFGTRSVELTGSYFLKALIVAFVILALMIASFAVAGFIGSFLPGASGIGSILGFVLSSYAVKSLLMRDASFERGVWVTLIAFFIIYVVEGIATIFGTSIIIIL